jgi:hypothetical protein
MKEVCACSVRTQFCFNILGPKLVEFMNTEPMVKEGQLYLGSLKLFLKERKMDTKE